jgi:hypothetical protein
MTESFAKLLVERADFGRLELQFEGDLFELEDQRNWGDASFKTYCTPLRLGFPRSIRAGTSILHRVDCRFMPPTEGRAASLLSIDSQEESTARDRPVSACATAPASVQSAVEPGVFPRLGREWRSSSGENLTPGHSEPAWRHVHLTAGNVATLAALLTVLESTPSTTLEVAVDAEVEPPLELLNLLSAHPARVSRLLLSGSQHSPIPSAASVERWRTRLKVPGDAASIPCLVATPGYFVEFNRETTVETAASGIAFPLTATVHANDAETIADNVSTIRDIAATARSRTGLGDIAIVPLALYHPRTTNPQHFPTELVLPWLAATLIHAALARVGSVTLSEELLEGIASIGPHAALFVTGLVECAGYEVTPLRGQLPAYAHGAVFRSVSSTQMRVLAVNLSHKPTVIPLPDRALREWSVRTSLSGKTMEINSEQVDLPGCSVQWIE